MMRGEDSRDVVRRFWHEVFNEGNLDVADELFDRDHVFHHPVLPDEGRGPEVMKAVVAMFRIVSPNARVTTEDEVAQDDKVVSLWTARGEAAEEMKGDEDPEVLVTGIGFFRVRDGRIQETWLRFESHEDYPRPVPKDDAVQERLDADPRLDPLGNTRGAWKCFWRPWTCRSTRPLPSAE